MTHPYRKRQHVLNQLLVRKALKRIMVVKIKEKLPDMTNTEVDYLVATMMHVNGNQDLDK